MAEFQIVDSTGKQITSGVVNQFYTVKKNISRLRIEDTKDGAVRDGAVRDDTIGDEVTKNRAIQAGPIEDEKRFFQQNVINMYRNNNDIHEVYPNLFLSNRKTAENIDVIMNHDINVIICITNGIRSGKTITDYTNLKIDYYSYSLPDVPDANIKPIADIVVKIIDHYLSLGKKVLVHCEMGISRSASLVIAYIMQKEGKNFEESLKHVKEKRNIVNPNIGFVNQLK